MNTEYDGDADAGQPAAQSGAPVPAADLLEPQKGGSYVRDASTGDLVVIQQPETEGD